VTEVELGELLAEDQAILSQYLPDPVGASSDAAKRPGGESAGDDP
jgi:hypothetical protein